MCELYNIANRANIEMFEYENKCIFLYDDHRTLLNVLFEAKKILCYEKVPNLIYFDRHDDACSAGKKSDILNKIGRENIDSISSKDFWSFVEFELSPLDDNWLLAGMELGLINHSVVIGQRENCNIEDMGNRYQTEDGIEHNLFSIPHLSFSISNRGCIGDRCVNTSDNMKIREIFQYNTPDNYNGFKQDVYPFILDFDLDCFTTECRSKQYAWPEKVFFEEYISNKAYAFLRQLIKRSQFVTICREPACCGGIGESNKILGYFDKYIFNGALGTEPIF